MEMKAFGDITKPFESLVARRSVDIVTSGLGRHDGRVFAS